MADSVTRIVPPSTGLDRSNALGREKDKRAREEAKKEKKEEGTAPSSSFEEIGPSEKEDLDIKESEKEKGKGTILDINV